MGKRAKKPEKEANHERWLVSYADFITLLFAVFVTLYAMGQTDKQKVEQLIISLHDSFSYSKPGTAKGSAVIDTEDLNKIPSIHPESIYPGKGQNARDGAKVRTHADSQEFKKIKAAIDAHLAKESATGKVGVKINERGLVVSLKEAGFFDSGSAEVKESSYQLLNKVAASLNGYDNPVRVEGHTDNIPINSPQFNSNWELSTSRATTVLRYLIDHAKYDPEKLSATGFGEYQPVSDNGTAEGRSKNRRVDLVLLSGEKKKTEP